MSYWDTSTLVKLYAQEPDSPAFESHAANATSPPITSRIALYEARASFRRKEAEGILTAGTAQKTYDELLQDIAANDVRLVELNAAVEPEYGQVLNLCYQQTRHFCFARSTPSIWPPPACPAKRKSWPPTNACATRPACWASPSSRPERLSEHRGSRRKEAHSSREKRGSPKKSEPLTSAATR